MDGEFQERFCKNTKKTKKMRNLESGQQKKKRNVPK